MEFIKLKSFIKIIRISYMKKKKKENFSLLNLTQHQRDKPQRLRKIYLEEI